MLAAGHEVMACNADTMVFERLSPLVCSSALDEEQHGQCIDKFAQSYFSNRESLPTSLHQVYDYFTETGTNLLFTYCNFEVVRQMMISSREASVCFPITETSIDCYQPPQVTEKIAKCMYEANNGGHIELFHQEGEDREEPHRFGLLGGLYTYPEFFAELAKILNATTTGPVQYNYYMGTGYQRTPANYPEIWGTVPQYPLDGTPPRSEGGGDNVDRVPPEPDSPDGPPRGTSPSDDIDRPSTNGL